MGAIKDAYEIVKELVKSTKSMVDSVQASEFCSRLLDVQSMIMDAREENEMLKEEINTLRKQIEDLKHNDLPEGIRWSNGGVGVYTVDGRNFCICRHCYDTTKKIVHVSYLGTNVYYCKSCNFKYHLFSNL